MAKKIFKISESQHNQIISEGIAIKGATDSTGRANIQQTATDMTNSGVDPKKTKVEFDGTAMTGGNTSSAMVGEHRLITKKELQANRLKYLKENSEVLSFNNFMKHLH